jgi:hypothetical protein
MVGWTCKMNWRGCERKRPCPNSLCCPGIYRERLAKITKNSESWTEPGTSWIKIRLTTRPTAKFDKRPSENSVWIAGNWQGHGSGWQWVLPAVILVQCEPECSHRAEQTWATNRISTSKLTYIHTRIWTLLSIPYLLSDAFCVGDFDSSQWKPASLRLLAWSCVSFRLSFRV